MLRAHSCVVDCNIFCWCQNFGTFALHRFVGTITFVIVYKCDFTLPSVLILKKTTNFTCWPGQCLL